MVIGEYDDPSNQKQGLVELNLSKRENIIIFGNAESGKETFLSTFIYDLITTYYTDQAQLYILDFGTEALKVFRKSPHVGDIIFMGQDDKLEAFFEMLQREIKDRKEILSDYNGDYNLYLSKGNKMPLIIVMINNYEVFDENYEDKYDDLFLTLTRDGSRYGIMFIVTSSNTSTMRYRLASNFNKKIALQLNNDDDYFGIFDNIKKKRPSHIFGRGLIDIDKEIFEFQTAKICEVTNYNEHIEKTIQELNKINELKATPIPMLPEKIELKDMEIYLKGISKVPIGMVKKNLKVYSYDFTKKFVTVLSAKKIQDAIELSEYIFKEIIKLENVKVNILDARYVNDNKEKSYNEFVKQIKADMKNNNEIFNLCAIIGIDSFASDGIIDEIEFSKLLQEAKEHGKHSFIIIGDPDSLSRHSYDDWYAKFISQDSGIWVGNGIDDQTLITTNFSMGGLENNCGNSFGYVVDEGNPTLIKFIGIQKEGDEDE